jgi:hypothetical protein
MELDSRYLEKLSSSGVPTAIEMLTVATPVLQSYQFNLDSTSPVVQTTEKDDILRLKVVIPAGPPTAMVSMSDVTVAIPSGSGGIPPVRLRFEESQQRTDNELRNEKLSQLDDPTGNQRMDKHRSTLSEAHCDCCGHASGIMSVCSSCNNWSSSRSVSS